MNRFLYLLFIPSRFLFETRGSLSFSKRRLLRSNKKKSDYLVKSRKRSENVYTESVKRKLDNFLSKRIFVTCWWRIRDDEREISCFRVIDGVILYPRTKAIQIVFSIIFVQYEVDRTIKWIKMMSFRFFVLLCICEKLKYIYIYMKKKNTWNI